MKTFLKRAWTEIHLDRLKDNFTELKTVSYTHLTLPTKLEV